jgi:deoxyribodipyrimidine photolyase
VRSAIVLFNRDLRVHDHPALTAAGQTAEHEPSKRKGVDYPEPIVDHGEAARAFRQR